jgi:hypothetical protein
MELLLNLCWLLLALPCYWLWRRDRASNRVRSVLVLGCMLVLLFPVVSATDDLHVIRPEMEEPGPSKKVLKAWSQARANAGPEVASSGVICQAGQLTADVQVWGHVLLPPVPTYTAAALHTTPGRAPPASILA